MIFESNNLICKKCILSIFLLFCVVLFFLIDLNGGDEWEKVILGDVWGHGLNKVNEGDFSGVIKWIKFVGRFIPSCN